MSDVKQRASDEQIERKIVELRDLNKLHARVIGELMDMGLEDEEVTAALVRAGRDE